MKIEWNINPLETKVFLDDSDRKYLRLAIRLEAALNAISYRDGLAKKESPEDRARYEGYIKRYDDIAYDEDEVSAKIDEEVKMYEEELQSSHIGDCTCFACSCGKCWAESLLGINTIDGLYTHQAYKIYSCFMDTTTKPWTYVEKTIDQVLEELSKPMNREKNEAWKNSTQEEYEKHIPRWEKEREDARAWMQKYKEEHNF